MTTSSAEERARQHKERGAEQLAKGRLEAALGEYKLAVAASPHDTAARRKVAELLARLGRGDEAVRAYQQLVGKFAAEGRLLEAIALCKVVLQLDPKHLETQATLARLYALRESTPARLDRDKVFEPLPASMSGAVDLSVAKAARTTPSAAPRWRLPAIAPGSPPEPPSPAPPTRPAPPMMIPVRPITSPELRDTTEPELEIPRLQPLAGAPPRGAGDEPPHLHPQGIEVATSQLPATPLFSELPAPLMQALLERLAMHPFAAGEKIVVEGETGRSLFVIASGSAEVIREGQGGERQVIARMPQGTFFGEIGLIADVPRVATVVAREDCAVLEVTREVIAELTLRFPYFEALVHAFYKTRLLQNLLRSSPLFASLSALERAAVIEQFTVRRAPRGELLIEQGAPGPGLFLLLRGRCSVSFSDHLGSFHPLPELGEGAVMGEISLLDQGPATATVEARTECVLLFLAPGAFRELLLSNSGARVQMEKLRDERLQRTAELERKAVLDPAFL